MNEKDLTSSTKNRGFTLVELLIVVAIIGIIAAIAIPNLLTALQKGKQKATMGDMRTIGTAIGAYLTAMSTIPHENDMEGLLCLEPHFIKKIPSVDGWNFTWHYRYTCHHGMPTNAICEECVKENSGGMLGSGGKRGNFTWEHSPEQYLSVEMSDFEKDIIFSGENFTYGPKVKK